MVGYALLLQGLIDGTQPLPVPHPQRLSFPNNPDRIRELAVLTEDLVARSMVKLSDAEARHLLFKLAAWCSRRGAVDFLSLGAEIDEIGAAVEGALIASPKWLTSKAGVGWAIGERVKSEHVRRKKARRGSVEPPRVCDVGTSEFYLVELVNGRQVYEEGRAIGHCMDRSFNLDVLKKWAAEGAAGDKLECLTYAVKIRSGELRLFSLRAEGWEPLMSIEYDPKKQEVVRLVGKTLWFGESLDWTPLRCDVVHALSHVVPIRSVYWEPTCRVECERRPWCQTEITGSHPLANIREDIAGIYARRQRRE